MSQSTSTAQLFFPYVRNAPNGEDTAQYLWEIFEEVLQQGGGCVKRIDLKPTKCGRANMAFMHLNFWPTSREGQSFKAKIDAGQTANLYYTDRWYWKVVAYTPREPIPAASSEPEKFTPYLEFTESVQKKIGFVEEVVEVMINPLQVIGEEIYKRALDYMVRAKINQFEENLSGQVTGMMLENGLEMCQEVLDGDSGDFDIMIQRGIDVITAANDPEKVTFGANEPVDWAEE